MRVRQTTSIALVLVAFGILAFQNCAPTLPTEEADTTDTAKSLPANAASSGGTLFDSSRANINPVTGNGTGGSSTSSGSYTAWNPDQSTTLTPPTVNGTLPIASSAEPRVNIYRLFNTNSGDHHLTINKGEVSVLLQQSEWKDEGIGFVLLAQPGANRIALYRCFDKIDGEHFVSYDPNCESSSVTSEGLMGYSSGSADALTSQVLYRCVSMQPPIRHLITTNPAECSEGNNLRIEGTLGFVLPASAAN